MSAINWSGNVKHSNGKFPLSYKSNEKDFCGTLGPSAEKSQTGFFFSAADLWLFLWLRCLALRISFFFFLAAIKLPLWLGTRKMDYHFLPLCSPFPESLLSDTNEVVHVSAQTGSSAPTLAGDTGGYKLSGRCTTFPELLLPSTMLGRLTQT